MGYRINVVMTGEENIGEALKALSEGGQVPYDSEVYEAWNDACKVRAIAMEYFPAVTIEVV